MTSSRPYLIRALYEWIADNNMTPLIIVDATAEGVQVPRHVVQDGQVVLNISMQAANGLSLDNDWISFAARFSGRSETIHVPPAAVRAIFPREAPEQRVVFPPEPTGDGPGGKPPGEPPEGDTGDAPAKPGRPGLRVVK